MSAHLFIIRLSGDFYTKARKTRMRFFRRLVVNLEAALVRHGIPYRLQKTWSRMYLETPDPGAAEIAARVFGVTQSGTFEHGASVLQRRADPDDPGRFDRIKSKLLQAREQRVHPGRDDKVVAAWNGLAISALAECSLAFGQPYLLQTARDAASLLAEVHLKGTKLMRTSRGGYAGDSEGVLEDYACVAEGFAVLSGITGEPQWLTLAGRLLDTALDAFGDGEGGFYDTAADGESLIFRPADAADNATPSGNAMAATARR